MNLSPAAAARLLRLLVTQIREKRFNVDDPRTFLGYGETLKLLELPPTATRADTDGKTLQLNGLNDLARWIREHPKRLPRITGLIVSKQAHDEVDGTSRMPNVPGKGYFKEYGKNVEDWTWWLEECRKSLEFDWTPYIGSPPTHLDAFARTLIEKAGYSHGWENVRESTSEKVVLYSARHKAEAHITPSPIPPVWQVTFPKGPPGTELTRSFPRLPTNGGVFEVSGEATLGQLLRRAAELSMSLPNQAAEAFAAEVADLQSNPPSTTELLAWVKQRRGQDLFRQALMDYWGGACAVTGIAVPELLRASHAKPWADCVTDEERLNVFNGFLLCAHLDALFDCGFLTFDESGQAILSPRIDKQTANELGLSTSIRLRWIASGHLAFLSWHRKNVFRGDLDH